MNTEDKNAWADIVGPCYTAATLARELGWSEDEVADETWFTLLPLETREGRLLYPAFQVHEGRLVDGIADVMLALSVGTHDSWTWAQWLNTPVHDETGEDAPSAIEQLRAGRLEDVLRDARRAASSWSS